MNPLEEHPAQCPNCWETISLLVDCSVPEQDYVEDCPVCCRPFRIRIRTGDPTTVEVSREEDA